MIYTSSKTKKLNLIQIVAIIVITLLLGVFTKNIVLGQLRPAGQYMSWLVVPVSWDIIKSVRWQRVHNFIDRWKTDINLLTNLNVWATKFCDQDWNNCLSITWMWLSGPQWIPWLQWNTWDTWPQWNTGLQWLQWPQWNTWNTWPQWNTGLQWLQWLDWTWFVDNLWNHIAIQNLQMKWHWLSNDWDDEWINLDNNWLVSIWTWSWLDWMLNIFSKTEQNPFLILSNITKELIIGYRTINWNNQFYMNVWHLQPREVPWFSIEWWQWIWLNVDRATELLDVWWRIRSRGLQWISNRCLYADWSWVIFSSWTNCFSWWWIWIQWLDWPEWATGATWFLQDWILWATPFWNWTSRTTTNTNIFNIWSNVGIWISNPLWFKLKVNGNSYFSWSVHIWWLNPNTQTSLTISWNTETNWWIYWATVLDLKSDLTFGIWAICSNEWAIWYEDTASWTWYFIWCRCINPSWWCKWVKLTTD